MSGWPYNADTRATDRQVRYYASLLRQRAEQVRGSGTSEEHDLRPAAISEQITHATRSFTSREVSQRISALKARVDANAQPYA